MFWLAQARESCHVWNGGRSCLRTSQKAQTCHRTAGRVTTRSGGSQWHPPPPPQSRPGTGRGDQETDTGQHALGTRKAAACRSRLRGSVAEKAARGSAEWLPQQQKQQKQQQSSQSLRSARSSIPAPGAQRPPAPAGFLFRFLGSSPARVYGAGAAEQGTRCWGLGRSSAPQGCVPGNPISCKLLRFRCGVLWQL